MAMTPGQQAAQEDRCRARHGFWLSHGPGGGLWVMVPAGTDPTDGLPLTSARPALPDEALMWQHGLLADLARRLAAQGMPVRVVPSRPSRSWTQWVAGLFGGRADG